MGSWARPTASDKPLARERWRFLLLLDGYYGWLLMVTITMVATTTGRNTWRVSAGEFLLEVDVEALHQGVGTLG